MQARIDMLGIITSRFNEMRDFYKDVMAFKVQLELDNYVEFENDGVRFALSTHAVMAQATGQDSYKQTPQGHSFELAFRSDSPDQVDLDYAEIVEKGATAIRPPEDMPWGQRAAFIADPDGNIHEIFADLAQET